MNRFGDDKGIYMMDKQYLDVCGLAIKQIGENAKEFDDNSIDSNNFTIPYIVIMSQDCDLDNDFKSYQAYSKFSLKNDLKSSNFDDFSSDQKNQLRSMYDKLLPSVLICPAFPASEFRYGLHLNWI